MPLFQDHVVQRGLFDPPEPEWQDSWDAPAGRMPARGYQQGMVEGFFREWRAGHRCVLAVSATGTGKTVSASHLARLWAVRCGTFGLPKRVLFMAHREELVFQTAATMREVLPGVRIEMEMADFKVKASSRAQIVVASTATLFQLQRLLRFGWDDFGLVIVDEAHHATKGNDMYDIPLGRFRAARVAGITATPERSDGRDLSGRFTAVAYRYQMPQAIADGWLVPLVTRQVWIDELDLSAISGRFRPADVDKILCEETVAHKVCRPVIEIAHTRNKWPGERQAIVFAASVEHARVMANVFNRWHQKEGTGTAAAIDCDASHMSREERRAVIRQFKEGKVRYLTNYGVLCLDAETEILTDQGWTGIDGMTMEHRVANYVHESQGSDQAGSVFFAPPRHIVRRDRFLGERMVSVENRRQSIRVTEDHRMLASCRDRDYRIIHAARLAGGPFIVPVAGRGGTAAYDMGDVAVFGQGGNESRLIRANAYHLRKAGMPPVEAKAEAVRRLRARMTFAVGRHPHTLSVDECRFIGFFLAEGHKAHPSRGGVDFQVSASLRYPRIIEWFDRLVVALRIHCARRIYPDRGSSGVVRWSFARGTSAASILAGRIGVGDLEAFLDGGEYSWMQCLDESRFDGLIEGLWYGDGDHRQAEEGVPESIRWSNTDKALMDAVQAAAVVKGWSASIGRPSAPRGEGHAPLWRMSMSRRLSRIVLGFAIEQGWKPERVWCVTSDTGNIITRRHGKVTITGNTEGFDAPRARIVAIARLTSSAALYEQMLGRGMRPWPDIVDALNAARTPEERHAIIAASPKPSLMAIDFAGNTGRHNLASAADILGVGHTKEEVKRAKQAIREASRDGKAIAVELELARARNRLQAEAEEARRKGVLVGVKWSSRDIDPFGSLKGMVGLLASKANRPTERQLEALRKAGVPHAALKKMSAEQASGMLDEMRQRRLRGLCTYAQARKVVRQGFPDTLTFEQAREVMEALRNNGWRPLEPWVRDALKARFGLPADGAGG